MRESAPPMSLNVYLYLYFLYCLSISFLFCLFFLVQDTLVFDVWFKVDARPFKQALLNIIKRWSFMFKEHLISHVTTSLNNLEEFIRVTSAGFNVHVEEGDYDGLVGVMGHLLAVKDRQPSTGIAVAVMVIGRVCVDSLKGNVRANNSNFPKYHGRTLFRPHHNNYSPS